MRMTSAHSASSVVTRTMWPRRFSDTCAHGGSSTSNVLLRGVSFGAAQLGELALPEVAVGKLGMRNAKRLRRQRFDA